jgi:hypothetical protein
MSSVVAQLRRNLHVSKDFGTDGLSDCTIGVALA